MKLISTTIGRRDLLVRAAPACAAACAGLASLDGVAAMCGGLAQDDLHKFDLPREVKLSKRRQLQRDYGWYIRLATVLRQELGEAEAIRLLNQCSEDYGRRVGTRMGRMAKDTSFQTWLGFMRDPAMKETITHEFTEETEKAVSIRVSECIHAEILKAAGLGGEIGHAAVCNMDYATPMAFNPSFRMERSRTLMQGHDHCNHRYVDLS